MEGSSPSDTMVKLEGEEREEVMEVEDVKQEPEDPLPEDVLCDFSVPVRSPESIKEEPEMAAISPLTKQTYRCQFCDNALIVNELNIGPKGLATLQRVSERRQDNRFPPDFIGPVQGHKKCRTSYTNVKCIDAVEKRLKKMDVTQETVHHDDSEETTPPTRQGSSDRAETSLSQSRSDIVDLDSDAESCSETSMSTPVFNIEVLNMKRKETMLNNSSPSKMKRGSNSNADKRFDYLEQCLFCGGNASDIAMMKCRKKASVVTRRETGEKMYRASLDYGPEYDEIRERIKGKDLAALRARYHPPCYNRFLQRPHSGPRGRRPDQAIMAKMDPVFKHIEENFEDSQFPIDELQNIAGDVTKTTLLYKILNQFGGVRDGDDIVVAPPVTKILEDNWHDQKLKDEKSERLRIVRTAANIILEDIRAIHFDTKAYPPSSSFLDEIDSLIPETLRTLVETFVTKYTKNPEPLESRVTALSHSIMSAVRPRTFKSPILLGIGSLIHLKFASKSLIDLLSSIGFCASYKDVSKLEMSAAFQNLPHFKPEFTQFVYDSMEVANKEIMVGVKCDTPSPKDIPIVVTDWKPVHPPLGLDAEFRVHLDKYVGNTSSLANIAIKDHRDDSAILPTRGDALWLFGNNEPSLNLPNWNAFLNDMPLGKESPKSKILPLPLIEAPPSKDAIYTAIKKAQKYSQGTCLVTFSQPLYQIAQEIVNSEDMTVEMCNVVLRLGGFDLLKAFLGVIGYIMSGSRLKELWCNIYSAEQVEKMMTGHAYNRALRAHFLTRSELFKIITKDFDLTPEERLEIEGLLEGFRHVACNLQNGDNQRNQEPLAITLELLEKRGSTAQLWVQYFRMTTLVAQFIEAEKNGNWDLHLSTLKKMLPYFHAAGYFDYAKSCTLYLQDMDALESKMDAVEYNNFTTKGYFSVKWTDHLGDFSDQVVEKTMTMLKRPGGVMNGTKTTDTVLPHWVSASPALSKIATLVEDFCKSADTFEPKIKDDQDAAILKTWFDENNPFPETVNLVSPSTGLIENTSNCHEAEMVGKQIMGKVVGENFRDVKYERSECVRPLSKSVIEIDDLKVPIEQDTILKRIPIKKNQEKVKSFFNYELAPYPISMFDEQGMLEADDSQIFALFPPVELPDGTNHLHVIDGEFLLHQIPWTEGATISAIAYSYVEYVKKNFKNAIVVFGGNKETNILKRSKIKGPIVEFQKDTAISVNKESFLSNDRNKDRLVQYLILDFTRSGIKIKLSSDHLHSHIVQIALDNSGTYDDVCVVSNDANVLMSMFRISDQSNFYFMHQGRRKMYTYVVNKKFYDKVENSVLFIQALTGCDTTSAIFQKDKKRVSLDISNILRKDYRKLISVFTDPTSDKNEIAEEGERFIRCLYSDDASLLHVIRYKGVVNSVTRSRYDLARLPPSKGAVIQHVYRTYHQIQKWLGNNLPPTEWGWRLVEDRLEPIMTLDEIAPKELLDMISCKCVGLCTNKCTCKRAGLHCCVLCVNCNGKSCHGLDMEKGASVVGNNILSRCDTFGNPFDPYPCTHYEDVTFIHDKDEVPEPISRPKRVKRDVNYDELRRQEVEELYIVEVQDE